MKLITFKSDAGLYVYSQEGYLHPLSASGIIVNGKVPESTFSSKYVLIPGEKEINSIVKTGLQKTVFMGWELVEPEKFPNFPKTIKDSECGEDGPEYRDLYNRKYEYEPLPDENIKFTEENRGCVSVPKDDRTPVTTYVDYGNFGDGKRRVPVEAKWDGLTCAIVTEISLENHPCCIPSSEWYKVIRSHIKENINPSFAEITSDYNFCFTVQKKIKLNTPKVWKTERTKFNGKSYRPPQFTSHRKEYELHPLFEMTHESENYKGYTPIPSIKGDNLSDLRENVAKYLSDLMNRINEEVRYCKHCQGTGVEIINSY
jgi:hypothetical protein